MARDGDRSPGGFRVGINRPHVGAHQTGPRLSLMDGSNTQFTKCFYGAGIGAIHISNNCWFHRYRPSNLLTLQRQAHFGKVLLTATENLSYHIGCRVAVLAVNRTLEYATRYRAFA